MEFYRTLINHNRGHGRTPITKFWNSQTLPFLGTVKCWRRQREPLVTIGTRMVSDAQIITHAYWITSQSNDVKRTNMSVWMANVYSVCVPSARAHRCHHHIRIEFHSDETLLVLWVHIKMNNEFSHVQIISFIISFQLDRPTVRPTGRPPT